MPWMQKLTWTVYGISLGIYFGESVGWFVRLRGYIRSFQGVWSLVKRQEGLEVSSGDGKRNSFWMFLRNRHELLEFGGSQIFSGGSYPNLGWGLGIYQFWSFRWRSLCSSWFSIGLGLVVSILEGPQLFHGNVFHAILFSSHFLYFWRIWVGSCCLDLRVPWVWCVPVRLFVRMPS